MCRRSKYSNSDINQRKNNINRNQHNVDNSANFIPFSIDHTFCLFRACRQEDTRNQTNDCCNSCVQLHHNILPFIFHCLFIVALSHQSISSAPVPKQLSPAILPYRSNHGCSRHRIASLPVGRNLAQRPRFDPALRFP